MAFVNLSACRGAAAKTTRYLFQNFPVPFPAITEIGSPVTTVRCQLYKIPKKAKNISSFKDPGIVKSPELLTFDPESQALSS